MWVALLALTACVGDSVVPEDAGAEDETGGGGPNTMPPMPPGMTSTTGSAESSGGMAPDPADSSGGGETHDESDDGSTFISDPGDVPPNFQCSVWEQDCPRGHKCMPWANDGGGSWNATKCTPIADDPGAPGDPCTVEESGVSGVDTCELGAMCWYVDNETLEGQCIPLCGGDESNPTCPENYSCVISGSGVITPCLPDCDPVEQDCPGGQACYPLGEDFACAPDVSGEDGAPGDACEFVNVCDPGGFCLVATAISDCDGSGCCVPTCDVEDDASDAECMAFDAATLCVPWFEKGQAPPGDEHIGVCTIPQD